jgi:cytoskeletal protein CcmA (bactofilin family)
MALQRINWTQIDTANVPSGSYITLASPDFPFEAVYAKNLNTSGSLIVSGTLDTTGDVVIGGNLTVRGTTTAIDSNTVSIGDNVIELNGSDATFGGLLIKDPTNPNKISGSLLWDTTNDYWIAGPLGSELPIVLQSGSGTVNYLQKSNGENGILDSRISDNGDIVRVDVMDGGSFQVTGSMIVKGDLRVEGTTTLVQTLDPNLESLIVSGAMSIMKNQIGSQIRSASLTIQNLGSWADRSENAIIDCGDGFF